MKVLYLECSCTAVRWGTKSAIFDQEHSPKILTPTCRKECEMSTPHSAVLNVASHHDHKVLFLLERALPQIRSQRAHVALVALLLGSSFHVVGHLREQEELEHASTASWTEQVLGLLATFAQGMNWWMRHFFTTWIKRLSSSAVHRLLL